MDDERTQHRCIHPPVNEFGDRIASHDCWCSVGSDHAEAEYADA